MVVELNLYMTFTRNASLRTIYTKSEKQDGFHYIFLNHKCKNKTLPKIRKEY